MGRIVVLTPLGAPEMAIARKRWTSFCDILPPQLGDVMFAGDGLVEHALTEEDWSAFHAHCKISFASGELPPELGAPPPQVKARALGCRWRVTFENAPDPENATLQAYLGLASLLFGPSLVHWNALSPPWQTMAKLKARYGSTGPFRHFQAMFTERFLEDAADVAAKRSRWTPFAATHEPPAKVREKERAARPLSATHAAAATFAARAARDRDAQVAAATVARTLLLLAERGDLVLSKGAHAVVPTLAAEYCASTPTSDTNRGDRLVAWLEEQREVEELFADERVVESAIREVYEAAVADVHAVGPRGDA